MLFEYSKFGYDLRVTFYQITIMFLLIKFIVISKNLLVNFLKNICTDIAFSL